MKIGIKSSLNIVVLGILLQAKAYGAIPPPPADVKPENPVPEEVQTQTGQPDPTDLPIDQPSGRPTGDTNNSNTPPIDWNNDMYQQLYAMQQFTHQMQQGNYSPKMSYYADWLYSVLDKLYEETFDSYGHPKKYAWGYATRGDFNHVFYYWIRPLYKKLAIYGSQYYSYKDSNPYYKSSYKSGYDNLYNSYHSLTHCMYGANSSDPLAEDDTEFTAIEKAAGAQN